MDYRVVIYRLRGRPSSNTASSLLAVVSRGKVKRRSATTLLCVGDKGREIYSVWELGAEEAKKIDTYYTKYEE